MVSDSDVFDSSRRKRLLQIHSLGRSAEGNPAMKLRQDRKAQAAGICTDESEAQGSKPAKTAISTLWLGQRQKTGKIVR